MKLRSLSLANFRKFREPLEIGTFSDGFNILIEPNEAGKSTLLEALRAALFIRHSAKTELVRSFCPYGDEVAPRIGLTFDLGSDRWTVRKQFLRSPQVELSGLAGRFESDAAEDKLQSLLSFERGNNRGSDPETRGVLGLLWVAQASALAVEPPGALAREKIQAALESEVGNILGGQRFEAIKAHVEAAYAQLRTPRTAKATGRLAEAEGRLQQARATRQERERRLNEFDQALTSLEQARRARRSIERELADPERAEKRIQLADALRKAEVAQLRIATALAQHSQVEMTVRNTEAQLERLEAAASAVLNSHAELQAAQATLSGQQALVAAAVSELEGEGSRLEETRGRREVAEQALEQARQRAAQNERHRTVQRLGVTLDEVLRLEAQIDGKAKIAAADIPATTIEALKKLDRRVTEAGALLRAGAVRLQIERLADIPLTMDGASVEAGEHELVRPAVLEIGSVVRLTVTPPGAAGRSAAAAFAAAKSELEMALKPFAVKSFSEALLRREAARAASEDVKSLTQQLDRLCPGEPTLRLAAGAMALKSWMADNGQLETVEPTPGEDEADPEADCTTTRDQELAVAAKFQLVEKQVHAAEKSLVAAQTALEAAERRHAATLEQRDGTVKELTKEALQFQLEEERRELAARATALAEAKDTAGTADAEQFRRGIANLDQADRRAQEERLALAEKIAALEATISADGPKGLAGLAREATEAEEAATAHLASVQWEADVLELLSTTLRSAGEEASRVFLGPVTQRSARYIERVLPGSGVTFDKEMNLVGLARSGHDEPTSELSRGTQEQLAVLTRLAFADLLLDRGVPLSLILDDPFAYADDARLEVMTDLLAEAATRMQVIILTCRAKAFRHVDAHRLSLP